MGIRIADSVKKTFTAGGFQSFAKLPTLVEHRMIYLSKENLILFTMSVYVNAIPANAFFFDIIMRIAFYFLPELLSLFTKHFAYK